MTNTKIIDCTTCKYGYEDEQLGIPMCHHPKRFSEDCVDFNMHEEKPVPKDLEEAADKYAEKHGFRVPYDGSDNFYDDVDVKASKEGFIAGAKWDRQQMMNDAVKWLVDEDYDELTDKGKFILGSAGIGYNGYYIPYSDLLKLPKEDER